MDRERESEKPESFSDKDRERGGGGGGGESEKENVIEKRDTRYGKIKEIDRYTERAREGQMQRKIEQTKGREA